MPVAWIEAIEAHGWTSAGSNQSYVFFEKPGYWLRIFRFLEGWEASVTPEYFRSSPDPASPFERYAETEMAPSFTGKGARARALAHAKALWNEHAAYLAPLGIKLSGVGVFQYQASGGAGSSIGTKWYREHDVAQD
jgi:hypothetical protein